MCKNTFAASSSSQLYHIDGKRQVKGYSVKSELQVLAVNPQLYYQKLNQPAGFFTFACANFFNHL